MSSSRPSSAIVAILAGGKAKRFGGQDKGEIIIDGKRLIDIIHQSLIPQSSDIIISGTHDYGLGFNVLPDAADAPGGPVGGVYTIWKNFLQTNIRGFFTVAVDGPNLADDLLDRLYHRGFSTVASDEAGRHPTYGWWRMVDLSKVFENIVATDSISLNRLADLVQAKNRVWKGSKEFVNINRKLDLDSFVKGA